MAKRKKAGMLVTEPAGSVTDDENDRQRYRQMFEKNRTVQLLIDPQDGAIVDANLAAAEFYGYSLEALTRLRISDINILPLDQIHEAMARAAAEEQPLFLFRHRLASGDIRDVEVRSSPVIIGSRRLLYSIIHDVTEQKRAEAALRHQVEFEKLAAKVSRLFLELAPENVDQGIHQALQAIGEFAGVDRSYLYLVSSDLTAVVAGYEWCAPGVKAELRRTMAMKLGSFAWAAEQLIAHEVLHVPRVADLPPEASAEKMEFEAQGVQSTLVVPLVFGPILGFMGFEVVRTEKSWSDESITLLKIVREIIAQALHRKRAEETVQAEARVSAALARVGQELIASLHTPKLLDRLCQVTAEVLECDYSQTYLWNPQENAYMMAAGWGDSPEQAEALRLLRFPSAQVQGLAARLQQDDVVHLDIAQISALTSVPAEFFAQRGVTRVIYMALRQGAQLVGTQTASYRNRPEPCTPQQQRIARGIAQLASLTLENARLLEETERANRFKSDFLATMSHELRTPLNIIIGYTDMLLEGDIGMLEPEQETLLQRVGASSLELLELINATLDVSRFEAGRLPMDMQIVDMAEFLAEIQQETANRVPKPGVTLEWVPPPAPLQVRTDYTKLKVVVKNLLGNAVKFTEQGTVRVEVRASEGGAEITVSDTGIGIPAEVLPIIFDMFRQGDSSTTRQYGGVGLGLYIVRRLLDILGGSVSVESTVGRGSTFRVWIPN
jgi:PAS domain S-box-containing protein